MKIDITDEENRIEAEKRISLKYPDKTFVPVWENGRLYMVDEDEISANIDHYQELVGGLWFVIKRGFVTMMLGSLSTSALKKGESR